MKSIWVSLLFVSLFCHAGDWKLFQEKKGAKYYVDPDAVAVQIGPMLVAKLTEKMDLSSGGYFIEERYYRHDNKGWSECLKKYVMVNKKGKIITSTLIDDAELKWNTLKKPYDDCYNTLLPIASSTLKIPSEDKAEEVSSTLVSPSGPQGDSTTPEVKSGPSRLRLIGQNGFVISFTQSSSCYDSHKAISVSGGMGNTFRSFIGSVKNISIGMPITSTVTGLKDRSGFLSKAYYREYEIASNAPIAIRMAYATNSSRSDPIVVTFTAKPGEDYEGSLDIEGNHCRAVINRIVRDGENIHLMPLPCDESSECR